MDQILEKYMPLAEGEEIISQIEGDAYNTSSNVIMRFIAIFMRIIAIITGSTQKVHVYVTNYRVITVEIGKFLWFFDASINARLYTPRSVSQMGYSLSRDLLIFKTHYLEFSSSSINYMVKSKNGKDKVYEMINALLSLAELIRK